MVWCKPLSPHLCTLGYAKKTLFHCTVTKTPGGPVWEMGPKFQDIPDLAFPLFLHCAIFFFSCGGLGFQCHNPGFGGRPGRETVSSLARSAWGESLNKYEPGSVGSEATLTVPLFIFHSPPPTPSPPPPTKGGGGEVTASWGTPLGLGWRVAQSGWRPAWMRDGWMDGLLNASELASECSSPRTAPCYRGNSAMAALAVSTGWVTRRSSKGSWWGGRERSPGLWNVGSLWIEWIDMVWETSWDQTALFDLIRIPAWNLEDSFHKLCIFWTKLDWNVLLMHFCLCAQIRWKTCLTRNMPKSVVQKLDS